MPQYQAGLIAIDWESEELPTLPVVAQKLFPLIGSPDISAKELSEIIRQDPSITMKILQIVNSALYMLSIEVSSLKHAIVLLGAREVQHIAISSILAQRFLTVPYEVANYAENLWRHSIATAVIAQHLTNGGENESLYTLGLLHDVGWIVLMAQAPTIYLAMARDIKGDIKEIERQWGTDHELWGAKLAQKWELPKSFQQVALRHHDPLATTDPPSYLLRIHLANYLANKIGFKAFEGEEVKELDPKIMEYLKLDDSKLKKLIEQASQKSNHIKELWRLLVI